MQIQNVWHSFSHWINGNLSIISNSTDALIKGAQYNELIKLGSQIYHGYLDKYGNIVIFSIVFTTNALSKGAQYELFSHVLYPPHQSCEPSFISAYGKSFIVFVSTQGNISVRANDDIVENDIIRIRICWLTN